MGEVECLLGLEVRAEGGEVILGPDVACLKERERKPEEIRDVLLEPLCELPSCLYRVYRGVHKKEDRESIESSGLRLDVTLLPPYSLGRELARTHGHFHSYPPGSKVSYPELYAVLSGSALFFLFTEGGDDLMLLEARQGDALIIPPDYGHITVNSGSEPLLLGNIIANDCESHLQRLKQKKGPPYFIVREGEGYSLELNPSFPSSSEPRIKRISDSWRVISSRYFPLYRAMLLSTYALQWLIRPSEYPGFFLPLLRVEGPVEVEQIGCYLKQMGTRLPEREMGLLSELILSSFKIITTGQGRSGLVGRAFVTRLCQLGFKAFSAGESSAPRISRGDLLIACSRSGSTPTTLHHARVARENEAVVSVLTESPHSPLAELADLMLLLEPGEGHLGGTLFEQMALIVLDGVALHLAGIIGKTDEDIHRSHTNLE